MATAPPPRVLLPSDPGASEPDPVSSPHTAMEASRRLVAALRRHSDDALTLEHLREQLDRLLPVERVALFGRDAERRFMPIGRPGEALSAKGATFEQVVESGTGMSWLTLPEPALPGDEEALKAGMRSSLMLPLFARDALVGMLVLYSSQPAAYESRDFSVLVPIVDLVAQLVLQHRIRETEAQLSRMQTQLAANEKLTSLGQLAAGVAHEINNPAAYVLTNLDHLRELAVTATRALRAQGHHELCHEMIQVIEDSLEGMHRIRNVVGDLRVFSRGAEDSVESVDVNRIVQAVVNMASSQIRARAKVELELGELDEIAGNRSRLTQVLLNLVLNGAQACDEQDHDVNVVRVATRIRDDAIEIAVSDTGHGIPEDARRRIFEPFFTTKPPGVGTGLGLAICRELVVKMGGTLRFRSTEGVGTTFTVRLPIEPPPEDGERVSGRFEVYVPGRPRVLIVDDEAGIRRALGRVLRKQNEVTVAASSEEALEIVRNDPSFDIVVSDLFLPGLSGAELYERLVREHPELGRRMLFLTGGAISQAGRDFVRSHEDSVLTKPVDTARLAAIIQAVAAGSSVRSAVRFTANTDS